jgi:solute carrier family 10 (sodium/bile acid cotransporter), member 7
MSPIASPEEIPSDNVLNISPHNDSLSLVTSSPNDIQTPSALTSENESKDKDSQTESSNHITKLCHRLIEFYWQQEFLIHILLSILLAFAYPPLGAIYLAPQITATWIAVILIFFLAGLSLKTEEFAKALQRIWFNIFVPLFNFGVVSILAYGLSRFLVSVHIVPPALADGMVICSTLPLTINTVLVLTKAAGGDDAAAVFHSAFGSMLGIFLSPLLILGYLGVASNDTDLGTVVLRLILRVVVPLVVGQLVQKFVPTIVKFVQKNKIITKAIQQYSLTFVVYTVFCKTFLEGSNSSVLDVLLMIIFQFILLVAVMGLSWIVMGFLFPNEPTIRVMGLFGCTHKTVAMGVPLINAMYEDNADVGLYTLPLLVWHNLQLILGTMLAPRLLRWVESENTRILSSAEGNHGIQGTDEEAANNTKADDGLTANEKE